LTEGIHKNWFFRVVKRPIPERMWRKMITFFMNRNLKKPEVDPAVRSELLDGFREDILKCQELIGRDLSHWLGDKTGGGRAAPVKQEVHS
jgi:hypothetical protein